MGQPSPITRDIKRVHLADLSPVIAKNYRQKDAMQYWTQDKNLTMLGSAGTGKTFLGVWLGLRDVLEKNAERLIVVRSAVPVRDIGFLPGTLEEKQQVYELPYSSILDELLPYKRGWDTLKKQGKVEFITTSYIRGITLYDAVVVVDECQSMTAHELDSIITRLGKNSRIIFCGDYMQSDLKAKERSGFTSFIKILESLPEFKTVYFEEQDIVRSGVVRDYIIARNKCGLIV